MHQHLQLCISSWATHMHLTCSQCLTTRSVLLWCTQACCLLLASKHTPCAACCAHQPADQHSKRSFQQLSSSAALHQINGLPHCVLGIRQDKTHAALLLPVLCRQPILGRAGPSNSALQQLVSNQHAVRRLPSSCWHVLNISLHLPVLQVPGCPVKHDGGTGQLCNSPGRVWLW
jgi:hypothetical protein